MVSGIRVSVLLLAAMILPMAVSAATKAPATFSRITHSGKVITGKALEIGIDHKGVKLEAITFSGDEAVVVVWNRTPNGVKGHVGIALYDSKNRLIAAESDSQSITRKMMKIRAGKTANFKIKFKKFMSSFKGAAKYRLVFVTST